MKMLSLLFGSEEKVKLMRVFLYNPDAVFTEEDLSRRTELRRQTIERIAVDLEKVGLITRATTREADPETGDKKNKTGWMLVSASPLVRPLRDIIVLKGVLAPDAIVETLSGVGRIKLIAIAGIFLESWDGRIDLLVVGDRIDMKKMNKAIARMEMDLGRELRYAVFDTKDFEYRHGVNDRLLRDVFDFAHTVLVDKTGVFLKR